MIINLFLIRQRAAGWETRILSTTYRALLREELGRALGRSGFGDIRWLEPSETGYFQQVVAARAG
jgi:hypothetical protein